MSRIVDNLIAIRILHMLVKPFTDTDAFKLGIIDAEGKNIKRVSSLASNEEKDAYTYLHRLVFNVKKLINRLPGGENRLKSLVAGLWLVKEQYENTNKFTNVILEEKFDKLLQMMDNRVSLVEEEIIVKKFLDEEGMGAGAVGGAPTNNTAGASVSEPKIYPKDVKKYKKGQGTTIAGMVRRPSPV